MPRSRHRAPTPPAVDSSLRSALSVYDPDAGPEPPPEQLTLRDAYERFLLPKQQGKRADGTLSGYRTALKHWEAHTGDPPVSAIRDETLEDFAAAMQAAHEAKGQNGRENVRKTLRTLHAIFAACAERGPGNPRGRTNGGHLLRHVPYVEPPQKQTRKKRVASAEDLSAIYEGCDVAQWPPSLTLAATLVWRTMLVLAYHYGPRTGDLIGLRWSAVHWEPECPDPDYRRLKSPWGWISYVPTKTVREKPEPLLLPMTSVVRAHLEALPLDREAIFGIPRSKRDLHWQRQAIQYAAGIRRPYTFQHLRQTCATAWNDLWPGLGEHVTGHAPRGVNAVHYDQALFRLVEHAPKLPQPEAFLTVLTDVLPRPETGWHPPYEVRP